MPSNWLLMNRTGRGWQGGGAGRGLLKGQDAIFNGSHALRSKKRWSKSKREKNGDETGLREESIISGLSSHSSMSGNARFFSGFYFFGVREGERAVSVFFKKYLLIRWRVGSFIKTCLKTSCYVKRELRFSYG